MLTTLQSDFLLEIGYLVRKIIASLRKLGLLRLQNVNDFVFLKQRGVMVFGLLAKQVVNFADFLLLLFRKEP